MLKQAVQVCSPVWVPNRNMATLKDISIRLKSVSNIQKITKSMKMVSAAKYARAERDLKPARPYGKAAQAFYDAAEVETSDKGSHLIVAVTSDRGLCGAVHSSIVRAIRATLNEAPAGEETKLILIGDKARGMLHRQHGSKILMTFSDVGKKPPTFNDASEVANQIMNCGFDFERGSVYYNVYKSVVSYQTTTLPIHSMSAVTKAKNMGMYDSVDDELLRSYSEFQFASLIYYAMKEAATSEQSSRMTAMDGASKNAGEMIDKLTLTYNRTRQAVITRELIEIISGAAAV